MSTAFLQPFINPGHQYSLERCPAAPTSFCRTAPQRSVFTLCRCYTRLYKSACLNALYAFKKDSSFDCARNRRNVKDDASPIRAVGTVHVPARHVPIPSSLSASAQAQMARPSMIGLPYPATGERAAWVAYAAAVGCPPDRISHAGSNALGLACAHGIRAELFIDESGSHGGFSACPESEQMLREVDRFLSEHWV
jgi:hypothetical protein